MAALPPTTVRRSNVPAWALVSGRILLVEQHAIPAATADELRRVRPERIVVLGGAAAVSDAVAHDLQSYAAPTPER